MSRTKKVKVGDNVNKKISATGNIHSGTVIYVSPFGFYTVQFKNNLKDVRECYWTEELK